MDVNSTVRRLAEMVGGKVVGDGDTVIHDAASLGVAGPDEITFFEGAKQVRSLATSRAGALIAQTAPPGVNAPVIEVDDPLGAFLTVFKHFHRQPEVLPPGIDSRAYVHPSARLGDGVSLQPFVTVGENAVLGDRCRLYSGVVVGRNCVLGDDVTLFPNVVVYDGCRLGDRTIVHANAVIGADGFGYRFQGGRHQKIPQLGSVEIGADVEIGACSTVDRGTFQATRVREGTKIDNHVQVAHNCVIGRHNLLVAHAALAGSCSTGDFVVLAGQAGIADHVHLGDGVMVGAQAGVIADVPAGQRMLGSPARPARETKVWLINTERVAELRKDVKLIKAKLGLNGEHA